ncbi:DUF222 domain-containing protein [Actinopolymorpha sp. NPDC004070]|uniref:DUF222 domain-containing protein n=1 Tax=Actinopolymorpha sp. NPDC004070 TaxID=3154548 RepID=UPI0033BA3A50
MYSTTQDLPGAGGNGAAARLRAAVALFRAGLDEALATPTTSLEARELGELISELTVEESRAAALKLSWIRQAEARDIGKTTGAATTAAWLRNAQRMGKKDSYATVALARDLDRTITLTARALARGELSFRHAQVIAGAIKDLPKWVGLEQRVKAEEYLIEESKRRNPDDVRLLGRALLHYLAPEESERRLGKELDDAERAAERSRSLKYAPNGIPGSETVVIKLPVLEMEVLRKLVEALVARDTRPEPDDRPLDQKRGDAFAELVAQWAQHQASPNRGRGRDCVTVLIDLQNLMNGVGYGTIDDLNPVRPMPCGCQTPDAQRQAQRKTKRKAKGQAQDETAKRTEGSEAGQPGSGESGPDKTRPGTAEAKPANSNPSKQSDDAGDTASEMAEPSKQTCDTDVTGDVKPRDNAGPSTNATAGSPSQSDVDEEVGDPDLTRGPGEAARPADTGAPHPGADPGGTADLRETTGGDADDLCRSGGPRTTSSRNGQPGKAKLSPAPFRAHDPLDAPSPPGPGIAADRIPGPREPGQPPQPNTATGTRPDTGTDPDAEREAGTGLGSDPETDTGPEDCDLGAQDDADTETQGGTAGSKAASDPGDPDDATDTEDATDRDDLIDPDGRIDPHDGCSKCGGGGSARILGLRGEPISVATIRRMACDANIIPVVLGGNGEVLDVGMADRFFTEAQRRALAVRDGSHCHFPECQVPERRCVAHHMNPWDSFGPTDLANGVLLCKAHHTFVHHRGWQVRMGAHGHPEYIPPEWVDPQQKVQRP